MAATFDLDLIVIAVSFTRPLSIYGFLSSNSIANLVFTSIKTILLGVTKSE